MQIRRRPARWAFRHPPKRPACPLRRLGRAFTVALSSPQTYSSVGVWTAHQIVSSTVPAIRPAPPWFLRQRRAPVSAPAPRRAASPTVNFSGPGSFERMDGPRTAGVPPGAVTGVAREPDAIVARPAGGALDVERSERDLIDRARIGDPTALAVLYDAHYSRVYGYIRYKVSHQEDAEDLTQEVFIRMLDALDRYQHRGAPFRSWLMQIAANLVRDHYRRKGTTVAALSVDVSELDLVGDGDPADKVELQLALEEVTGALHLLTDTEREVMLLRYVADLNIAETAAATGKNENNVKQLTFKALGKLRKALLNNNAGTAGT